MTVPWRPNLNSRKSCLILKKQLLPAPPPPLGINVQYYKMFRFRYHIVISPFFSFIIPVSVLSLILQESIHNYYEIHPREDRQVERFGGHINDYRILIRPLDRLLSRHSAFDVVSALFQSIIRRITRGFNDNDRVGFVIASPNLRQDVGIPLTRLDQLSVERILAIIEQILQSNKEFWLLGGFEIGLFTSVCLREGNLRKMLYL